MKVHLACGDVFLTDYVNCDISGELVTDRAAMPPRDLSNYYSHRMIGYKHPTVVDRKFDLTCFPWPFDDESAEEAVMIQAIEHFELKMAQRIVDEVQRILVPGGKFLVDFPDLVAGVKMFADANHDLLMRFIYCNHKNQYSVHHWGYTRESFPCLLGFGWDYQFREIVHHQYPTIGVEVTKTP